MPSQFEKADLVVETDLSSGDWIRDTLTPWKFQSDQPLSIGIVIPRGFESYVMVHHQSPSDYQGCLGRETLGKLIDCLGRFTTTPQDCFHAIWDGRGWMYPGSISTFQAVRFPVIHRISFLIGTRLVRWRRITKPKQPDLSMSHLDFHSLPDGVLKSGRLKLPNRDYLLLRGPLSEANKIGYAFGESIHLQSPNLLWPADRAWILATEIDFDVTLVGGSEELIKTILSNQSLRSRRFDVADAIGDLPVVEQAAEGW